LPCKHDTLGANVFTEARMYKCALHVDYNVNNDDKRCVSAVTLEPDCVHQPATCLPDAIHNNTCWLNKLQAMLDDDEDDDNQPKEQERPGLVITPVDEITDSNITPELLRPTSATTCGQCAPGTNTFAFCGDEYKCSCVRYYFRTENQPTIPETALCMVADGSVKSFRKGDFIAISHVRAQGWEGFQEDGICSRVLEILTTVARKCFSVEGVWLDAAMNSSERSRKLTPDEFNWIYRNAKVVLVCDRKLLGSILTNPLDKVSALLNCEWNTRVWTMNEAMSNTELWVLQHGYRTWSVRTLLSDLAKQPPHPNLLSFYTNLSSLFLPSCGTAFGVKWRTLDCIIIAGRNRRARRPLHLLKALFSLFDLKWQPSTNKATTLEAYKEAHTIFMTSLGTIALRTISLFAPFGIPGPYSWAPLTLFNTQGLPLPTLEIISAPRRMVCGHKELLVSRWLGVKVKPEFPLSSQQLPLFDQLPLHYCEYLPQRIVLMRQDGARIDCLMFCNASQLLDVDTWLWLICAVDLARRGKTEHLIIGKRSGMEIEGEEEVWTMQKLAVLECKHEVFSGKSTEFLATWE